MSKVRFICCLKVLHKKNGEPSVSSPFIKYGSSSFDYLIYFLLFPASIEYLKNNSNPPTALDAGVNPLKFTSNAAPTLNPEY